MVRLALNMETINSLFWGVNLLQIAPLYPRFVTSSVVVYGLEVDGQQDGEPHPFHAWDKCDG